MPPADVHLIATLTNIYETASKELFITKRKSRIICSLLAVFLVPASVLFGANIPPHETAGSEESRFKDDKFYEKKQLPAASQEAIEQQGPSSKESKVDTGPRFLLKEFRFSGNEMISTPELLSVLRGLIGTELSLSDAQKAAGDLESYYKKKGFVAAYVSIPPQHVQAGILEIQIMEGRLGKIQFSGNHWFSSKLLRRMFRLKDNPILKYEKLRRDLVRINKNEDLKVKAVLMPGVTPGTTDAEIQVQEKRPYHLSVDTNNLGTRNTGVYRWGVTAVDTNLLGRLDRLLVRFQAGKKTYAESVDYLAPLFYNWGTKLGLAFSRADVAVGGEFSALGVKGSSTTYGAYFLQPAIETEKLDATLKLGFDWKSVENRILGTVSGKDELRILNTGANFEERDSQGQTFSGHEFNFGLTGILGASSKVNEGATRTGSGGQFFVYRGSLVRYQRITDDILLSVKGTLQLTPDLLAPSEQLRLGGANSIRGYQEGEYLGDYGGTTTAEVFVPTYFFPPNWKLYKSKEPLRKQVQLVGFTDFGYGALHGTLVGEKKSRTLAGAGGGLRIHLYDKAYARLEWAAPLGGDHPTDHRRGAFYFGISMELI